MTDSSRSRQVRRKVLLELLSLVTPLATAIGLSTILVAHASPELGLFAALATALGVGASWTWHRSRHPPGIAAPTADEPGPGAHGGAEDGEDGEVESLGDRAIGLLLVVAVVIGIAAVAITGRFLLALLTIASFAVGNSASDLGEVVLATVGTLAVGLVVELGVVAPLARRWDLDLDETPGLSRVH